MTPLPLYSRYVLSFYFKNFFLTLSFFLGLVLLLSLKEITLFAALSPSYSNLFLFSIYQIPYILPLALPLSSLLSTLLLIKRLASSFELVAFRASGFSLKLLAAPILFIGFGLSLLNFYIISEVTTSCRLSIRQMLYKKSSNNPLVLLQRGGGLTLQEYAIDMNHQEGLAQDFKLAFVNPKNGRVNLLMSPYVRFLDEKLEAKELLFLSYSQEQDVSSPSLLIQQADEMRSDGESIGSFLKKNRWKEETHALPLQLLLKKGEAYLEITRRLSLALFPLSFTWIGFMLFTSFRREERYREGAYLILLIIGSLLLYMVGKNTKATISYLLFILPHLILGVVGLLYLKRAERGV